MSDDAKKMLETIRTELETLWSKYDTDHTEKDEWDRGVLYGIEECQSVINEHICLL